jgi:transcription antitermination factor NusG
MLTHTNSRPAPPCAGAESHWYAVCTRPNHEKRVAEQLQRKNLEQLLPLYNSVRQWKDRKVCLAMPLFPGYVFVRISLQERLRVLEIPGVAYFVGFGNQAACLPEEDLRSLQGCMNRESNAQPHPYLCVGDRVRVKSGPLQGQQGFIVCVKNRTRLVLSFDSIRCSATLQADQLDVEPLGASA